MSLFGAMISGVSGLNAQSQNLGVISDNISNLNTIGYKGTIGRFSTLVTESATDTRYTPGGVRFHPTALMAVARSSSVSPVLMVMVVVVPL